MRSDCCFGKMTVFECFILFYFIYLFLKSERLKLKKMLTKLRYLDSLIHTLSLKKMNTAITDLFDVNEKQNPTDVF